MNYTTWHMLDNKIAICMELKIIQTNGTNSWIVNQLLQEFIRTNEEYREQQPTLAHHTHSNTGEVILQLAEGWKLI